MDANGPKSTEAPRSTAAADYQHVPRSVAVVRKPLPPESGTGLHVHVRAQLLYATAGLMSGNRNMALYLAILPAAADPRIGLFFGLCQFPLFLSPFLLRPLYQRLLRRRHARPAGGQSRR